MNRIGITIKEEFILFLYRNNCLESYFKHLLSDKKLEFDTLLKSKNEENWIINSFERLGYVPTFWKKLHISWIHYLFHNGSR